MYLEFNTLLENVKWRLPKNATIVSSEETVQISLSEDFVQMFPTLTELINKASVNELTINGDKYRFYQWLDATGESLGWLADMELKSAKINDRYANEIPVMQDDVAEEHLLLLKNTGGILETWGIPEDEDFLTYAKNFVFSFEHSYKFAQQDSVYGGDEWIYEEVAKEKQLAIIDLVCFSEEANGNLTFYNRKDKRVYLLLGDHDFNYVEELDGHPEYSFYTIKGVDTFTEYVELLASQILESTK